MSFGFMRKKKRTLGSPRTLQPGLRRQNVPIRDELWDRLRSIAVAERRTVGAMAGVLLEEAIARRASELEGAAT